jgi:nucleotide-binding universal stress UspA family protein
MSRESARVVTGISGSLANLAALRVSVGLARRMSAELVAVLAWAPVGGEFAYRRQPWPEMLPVWERAAHDRLRSAFKECYGGAPTDIQLDAVVIRADPGPALVHIASQPRDLLVIGTGRRGRTHVFYTAVHRYCLQHATCPVVSVPPPDMINELRRFHRWPGHHTADVGRERHLGH